VTPVWLRYHENSMELNMKQPMTSTPRTRTPPLRAARFVDDIQRWRAVMQHRDDADGHFFYGVTTTGIYCRPSCPSRRPRRANVRFFATAEAAERSGLRPCLRCHPREPAAAQRQAALIAQACHRIESSDTAPDLATLAREAALSPFHFHRLFKRVTGMTPRGYADAHRARRVRETLLSAGSVTQAFYEAGFGSNAGFYAGSAAALGMPPSAYRKGGEGITIRFAIGACRLGALLVAATERGICAISLGDDADAMLRELEQRFSKATLLGAETEFEQLVARVAAMVENPGHSQTLPLDLRGTAFQHRVWQALRQIPAGSTRSYAQLARELGVPRAVRAVASAVAANTLAVAIPCHRVIRQDGTLSGYRWGVERKQALLEREALVP
jgi:AraC family transcriptional regulator of adaptative response/methylated-DNA-[protein]-cysteine methyltransferase